VIQLALLALTLAGLILLVWRGQWQERAAAAAVTVYLAATPLLEPIKFLNWRVGVAGAELVLFLIFWGLAEAARRWWLTAAAGFQLIAVLSFLVPIAIPDLFVWTGVAVRYGAWSLITFTLFAGAWEAWADSRFRRELDHGKPPRP
jgi:hypothetical protein